MRTNLKERLNSPIHTFPGKRRDLREEIWLDGAAQGVIGCSRERSVNDLLNLLADYIQAVRELQSLLLKSFD